LSAASATSALCASLKIGVRVATEAAAVKSVAGSDAAATPVGALDFAGRTVEENFGSELC
jgi:hypothetical protein